MRKLVLVSLLTLLMSASSASAVNLLVNGDWGTGDETGWTRWRAPWGSGENWNVTAAGPTPPEGTLHLNAAAGTSSFGWYQVVPVPASEPVTIDGDWTGDVSPTAWAEVMLFSVAPGTSANDIVSRIDSGAGADIAAKKDGWGLNPPDVWDWAPITAAPGDGGFEKHSIGWVVVALKLGTGTWNPNHNGLSASFDNLVLTPEPAAALLLGLPMLLLRRRR